MSKNPIYMRIEALLKRDGLTLKDLERRARIPYSRSYEWNRRETSKPNAEDLLTLSRFFNVPVEHIMEGSPALDDDPTQSLLRDYENLSSEGRRRAEQYVRFLLREQHAQESDEAVPGSEV